MKRISSLTIGKRSDMILKPRCVGKAEAPQSQIEVMNVAVRTDDFQAFLGIIRAREVMLNKGLLKVDGDALAIARDHTQASAGCGLDAHISLSGTPDRETAIKRLEMSAAIAISGILALKGDGS